MASSWQTMHHNGGQLIVRYTKFSNRRESTLLLCVHIDLAHVRSTSLLIWTVVIIRYQTIKKINSHAASDTSPRSSCTVYPV